MFRVFLYIVSVSLPFRVCCGQLDESLSLTRQSRPQISLNRKPTQLDPMLSGQWFLCKRGLSIQACKHNRNHRQHSSATALDLLAAAPPLRRTIAHCTAELCVHGTCTNNRCICVAGWKGKYCTNDVNECGKQLGPCSHTCINTPGSYTCRCRNPYTLGKDGRTCTPGRTIPSESVSSIHSPALAELYTHRKKEIKDTKLQQKRQTSQKSRKLLPSRTTALYRRARLPRPPSHITNNVQPLASLINEAEAAGRTAMHSIGRFLKKAEMVKHRISAASKLKGNPCAYIRCDHKCILTSKRKPACVCRRGFWLDRTTQRCVDRDECKSGKHSCQENSTCVNKQGGYSCKCNVGYVLSMNSSKTICQDINECLTGDHICNDQSVCINMPGFYRCECMEGYTGNGINCSRDGNREGLAIHRMTNLLHASSKLSESHVRPHVQLSNDAELTI